jgi:hypothetical protein
MSLPPPLATSAPSVSPQQWDPPLQPVNQLTARSLLFDTAEQGDAALQADLGRSKDGKAADALGKLSQVTRKIAQREIRRAILDLLDIGLAGVVQRGWQRHDELIAAGRRTSAGGREVVTLADHTITSTHSPHVSLIVDGLDLGKITITVLMSLRLIGISAVVDGGRLVAVEAGSIAATAKLSVEEVPITNRSQTLDAVKVMQLTKPLPLTS